MLNYGLLSELRLAREPHMLGDEVHRHKEPSDLSHECNVAVFLCDFDRARKQIHDGREPICLRQEHYARGLQILFLLPLQKRNALQLIRQVPPERETDIVHGDRIIVAHPVREALLADLRMRGEQGLDVGDRLSVTLLRADPHTGFIDFGR